MAARLFAALVVVAADAPVEADDELPHAVIAREASTMPTAGIAIRLFKVPLMCPLAFVYPPLPKSWFSTLPPPPAPPPPPAAAPPPPPLAAWLVARTELALMLPSLSLGALDDHAVARVHVLHAAAGRPRDASRPPER